MLRTIIVILIIGSCLIWYLFEKRNTGLTSPIPSVSIPQQNSPPLDPSVVPPSAQSGMNEVLTSKGQSIANNSPFSFKSPPFDVQIYGLLGQSPTQIKSHASQLRWTGKSLLKLTHLDSAVSVNFKVGQGRITQALFTFPPSSSSMLAMDIWPLIFGNETGNLELPHPLESPQSSATWTSLQTLPSQRKVNIHIQYDTHGPGPYGPKTIQIQFASE